MNREVVDSDIEISPFTLRYKLKRHGFDFRYDEKASNLKIGRSKPSRGFVFNWFALPLIIFVGQILVMQLLPDSSPLLRLDYFSYLTSFWLVISSGIVLDRRRLNNFYIEVGRDKLRIHTKSKEYQYQLSEIEAIEIDDSKSYEKESGFNFFRRGHLVVKTKTGMYHSILYVFGEKQISNWDDLRYLRKHILKILSGQ